MKILHAVSIYPKNLKLHKTRRTYLKQEDA